MGAEPKKISFGFTKTIKKVTDKPEEKKQFIDCLEGKSIKVKGGEIVEEKAPLVIPLVSKTTTAASLLRIAQEVENGILEIGNDVKNENEGENVPENNVPAPQNETLEAKAVRELISDVNKFKNVKKNEITSDLTIPAVENPVLIGEKESTIEDYDNIPIADFGLAMLRGMGWTPGKGMGKHKAIDMALPTLRPKGMGLGADKVTIQKNGETKSDKKTEEEELKIIKGSFVKIIAGKHNGTYGQVSGFDEDSGRLIVKAAIGGTNLNLSEFMVQAVSKPEYQKSSKVINSAKYEEYKNRDNSESSKHSERSSSKQSFNDRQTNSERSLDRDKYDSRRDKNTQCYESSKSDRSKYEQSSKSSHHRSRHEERRRQSSESDSDSSSEKRSRDKKRKGKKKKRDRSRSKEHRRRH